MYSNLNGVVLLALIAQRIEQIRPKNKTGVQFPLRAQGLKIHNGPIVKWYYGSMAWISLGSDSP